MVGSCCTPCLVQWMLYFYSPRSRTRIGEGESDHDTKDAYTQLSTLSINLAESFTIDCTNNERHL